MKISVIIPVYNVEKYLEECLDSIINQTYKDVEIILVDDGSTDSSGKICDEYANKSNTIKVIHKKNEGLGMARNTGLDNMSGEYVTFVDSDDYFKSDYLEQLYNAIILNKVDFCKSGFHRITNEKKTIKLIQYKEEVFEGSLAKEKLLPRMIGSSPEKKDSIEMAACATMYNADIIRKFQIRFPSERELISEDLIFNIDYMQHADGACIIEYVGYYYRYNKKSLSTSYRKDRFEASRYFYLELLKKLESLDYGNETVLRAQRMFFIYIRMSIAQEKRKLSGNTIRKNIKKISYICNDAVLQNVVNSYPLKELGKPQWLFLILIKYKLALVLYLFTEMKIL